MSIARRKRCCCGVKMGISSTAGTALPRGVANVNEPAVARIDCL